LKVNVPDHIQIAKMLAAGEISSTSEKEILQAKIDNPDKTVENLAAAKRQISDESATEKIVTKVLDQNPKAAEDLKNGETKAIGFLVGQVMAESRGQANPQLAQKLIKKLLGL
jgi:aspartyl-tRNA(Asn)/glutamyl-tRNA(Gln) amidotransferase subunit B